MTTKSIHLNVPIKNVLPDIYNSSTPEETFLMLQIGGICFEEARNSVKKIEQQDFYDKIKKETQIEIDKLKIDLLVKSELTSELKRSFEEQRLKDSEINKSYENKLQEKINSLINELTNLETKNQLKITECINREKEKYESLLVEKENQNEKTRDIFERASILINNKSLSKKGSDGEQKFANYADTFNDFSGF
jgi:hypothetical protein